MTHEIAAAFVVGGFIVANRGKFIYFVVGSVIVLFASAIGTVGTI